MINYKNKFVNLLFEAIYLLRPNANKICVLGDSHSKVFESYYLRKKLFPKQLKLCSVSGATISGLKNPNSNTNAKKVFEKFTLDNKDCKECIILIGEVDIGFLVWIKSNNNKDKVSEYIETTISQYVDFIKILASKFTNVKVVSAPLPTIIDNKKHFSVVANQRKDVTVDIESRTNSTIYFNKKVQDMITTIPNVNYINLDQYSLGKNGVVKDFLLNKNKADHHYCMDEYSKLLSIHIGT